MSRLCFVYRMCALGSRRWKLVQAKYWPTT